MGFKEYTDMLTLKDDVKKLKEEMKKITEKRDCGVGSRDNSILDNLKKEPEKSLYLNCVIILLDKLNNNELEQVRINVLRKLVNGLNDYV
jgi:hypothetical protein